MADRTVSVKLRADIADYVANMRNAGKATRDLESAGRDLRKALDDEEDAAGRARVSEAKLAEVRKNDKATVAQLAAAEEEHASNLRKVEAAMQRTKDATEKYAAAQKKAASDVDQAGRSTENTLSRVAARANAAFDAKLFLGLSVGLPAAAAVGAAGVTAALGLAAGGFAALGVWAAASSRDVQTEFKTLAASVQDDVRTMAAPIEGELTGAIGEMSDAWSAVRPAVDSAIQGSVPAVRELTGAATDFAENAMPGVVTAVKNSEPVFEGLRDLAGQTGEGLSDFFTNAAKGSADAGQGMRDLGGIAHDLLGQTGTLFANLASGAHQTLPQFGGALHQVLDTANDLTSHGMPTLVGTTSGFLGTVGGGLNILDGFASALGTWSAPIGSVGGSLLATNGIAKLFGTSLGETGFGLNAFATSVDAAGNKTSPFKTALADAEKNGTSKLNAGLKSIVNSGFNPLGIALTAGGLLLDAWGQKSQDAAKKAAEFNATVGDIKGTLSSTGAITQNTRVLTANNIQTKQLGVSQKTGADLMSEYGINTSIATDAMTGNKLALDNVNNSLKRNAAAVLDSKLTQGDWNVLAQAGVSRTEALSAALGGSINDYKSLDDAVKGTSGSTDDYINRLNSAYGAIQSATQGQRDLIGEIRNQAAATAKAQQQMRQLGDATSYTGSTLKLSAADSQVLTAALSAVGDAAVGVTDQGAALNTVLDQLSGKNNTLSAAQAASTKAFDDANKAIKNIKDSGGKLKGTFDDLVNSSGGINGLTAAGANLQGIFGELSQSMGTEAAAAFAQSQSAGDALGVSLGKVGDITTRTRNKFIDAAKAAGLTGTQAAALADKLGLVPSEVAIQFAAKGDTQLQDKLTGLVAQLNSVPANKGIKITADDAAAANALRDLGEQVVQLPDGSFQVFADTKEGKAAAQNLINEINHYDPVVNVDATTHDANAKVTLWAQTTNNTWGMANVDAKIDPATGKVQIWQRNTNGTWGWANVNSRTDPATGSVSVWVQQTNGKWAWVSTGANVSPASGQIDSFIAAQNRKTIRLGVYTYVAGNAGVSTSMQYGPRAAGGIDYPAGVVPMAVGGVIPHIPNIATTVRPGDERLIGDNKRFTESFIPWDINSPRANAILDRTNAAFGRPNVSDFAQRILSGSASVQQMMPRIVIPQQRMPAPAGAQANVTINTAQTDPNRLAAAMVSALSWQLR